MEIWISLKGIVEKGDNYEVSNFGSIRNTKHTRLIKPTKNRRGYLKVSLYKGDRQVYSVHRLVALAFLPNPENKPQVNHKDGNKQNNYVDNLEWATNLENQTHAWKTSLYTPRKGEQCGNATLTTEKVIEIRELYASGDHSYRQLAKIYGVGYTTVLNIITRKTWQHV